MRRTWPTYVRFVCFKTIQGQRSRLGLFQALDEARDSNLAPDWALKEIGETYGWFKTNLDAPPSIKLQGASTGWQAGLSWFKPGAIEHIQNMHRLKLALEECGVHVEVITTRSPGIIIWEDRHQILAKPGSKRF